MRSADFPADWFRQGLLSTLNLHLLVEVSAFKRTTHGLRDLAKNQIAAIPKACTA